MHIYFIRHTAPAIASGTCYGHTDVDLADSFEAEYAALQQKIPFLPTARIYSSPLQRCLKLANALAKSRNYHPVQTDERLKELNFGDWEMQTWQNIPVAIMDDWASDYVTHAPPNGESFSALHKRTRQFLFELCSGVDQTPALIFTHAGVIRALIAEAQQLPLNEAFNFRIDYASVTEMIAQSGAFQLRAINA